MMATDPTEPAAEVVCSWSALATLLGVGPMTAARLSELLGEPRHRVDAALARLVRQGEASRHARRGDSDDEFRAINPDGGAGKKDKTRPAAAGPEES